MATRLGSLAKTMKALSYQEVVGLALIENWKVTELAITLISQSKTRAKKLMLQGS